MPELDDIEIIEENGNLGSSPGSDDGIAAMALSGVAVADKIALLEPKQIFSTAGAKALGLDEVYDTANSTQVWKNIKDFYSLAGEGATLWIMLYINTTTMTSAVDKDNDIVKKMLNTADGKINFWGIARIPDGAYAPVYADGMDPDVVSAFPKAQALCEEFRDVHTPCRAIIDCRDYQGVLADLIDFTESSDNRVAPCMFTDVPGSKTSSIGLMLGRLAKIPCQQSPGRVKTGDLGVSAAYLTDGVTKVKDLSVGEQKILRGKGFCFMRKRPAQNGYFFTDLTTATSDGDDYSSFARGRVIDKAHRLAFETYTEEILDDLDTDDDGFMEAAVAKSYQAKIDNVFSQRLLSSRSTKDNNASGARSIIDPRQNVISTNKTVIGLKIRPKYYNKEMEITLGFENPALA